MYRKANIMFLIAETPMHAGSGDSLGIVDMPIQREKHTSFPKIEASSLKGSMREHFERELMFKIEKIEAQKEEYKINKKKVEAAFGDEGQSGESSKAGCLGFTDARLLLFPVKSMKGVFAWITCPAVLSKFAKDMEIAENKSFSSLASINNLKIEDQKCIATSDNVKIGKNNIVLEEFTFELMPENEDLNNFIGELSENLFSENDYWKNLLKTNLVVLTDNDFADFVQLSTEVITRTKIDNVTGTVADSALFTEEYLPAESIMYSLVLTAPEFAEKREQFKTEEELTKFFNEFVTKNNVMQIGGNATLGKGILKTVLLNSKKEEEK